MCGRAFDKAVKKLQQANYPFVTKIASMSGVRSYEGGEMLSFLFLPIFEGLRKLHGYAKNVYNSKSYYTNMELKEIEQFNDWWTSGTVRSSLLMPYKRQIYNEILNYLEDRQILPHVVSCIPSCIRDLPYQRT